MYSRQSDGLFYVTGILTFFFKNTITSLSWSIYGFRSSISVCDYAILCTYGNVPSLKIKDTEKTLTLYLQSLFPMDLEI